MANLLSNGSFDSGLTPWSGSQSSQTWGNDGGQSGIGYLLMTAGGTGTRSCSSEWVSYTPNDILSAGGWFKWATGATPRGCFVDIQWGDASNTVLATDTGTSVTPTTSGWTQSTCLNKSHASAVKARLRVRMTNVTETTEAVKFDTAQLNPGPTLENPSGSLPVTVWNGTAEVTGTVTLWTGSAEVAIGSTQLS